MSWLPIVDTIIDAIVPDADKRLEYKFKAKELEQKGDFAKLDAIVKVNEAQARINEEDAKSGSKFQAWWRPAAAWLCVFGIAYPIVTSLLAWMMQLVVWFGLITKESLVDFPMPPVIDTGQLFTLLIGLLGLGGMRSWERHQRNTTWGKE